MENMKKEPEKQDTLANFKILFITALAAQIKIHVFKYGL